MPRRQHLQRPDCWKGEKEIVVALSFFPGPHQSRLDIRSSLMDPCAYGLDIYDPIRYSVAVYGSRAHVVFQLATAHEVTS